MTATFQKGRLFVGGRSLHFYIVLKGDMWSWDSLSMESGMWKFSGISYYMASNISSITEIRPESAKYSDNALWAWYAINAPGSGGKRCCIP